MKKNNNDITVLIIGFDRIPKNAFEYLCPTTAEEDWVNGQMEGPKTKADKRYIDLNETGRKALVKQKIKHYFRKLTFFE